MGLFAAAWWGNWEILEDLVKHGENINLFVGATPLHMAVSVLLRGTEEKPELARRRVKTVEEFFRLGADPNIPAQNGETVLHLALDRGFDVGFFKLLMRHGANPDLPGKDGRTVRQIAARKRDKAYFNEIA
jgi:ankyrin repeat protein